MNSRNLAIYICTFLCGIALWLQAPAILAQDEQSSYKHDEALVQAIRKAKVINTSYPLRVLKNGTEVLVTTLRNPKATDKSSKIDAVLVAKAIMDADKKILIVHYRTKVHITAPDYMAITVKQSDVMAYGVNAIGVDSLLGQLKIVKRPGRHAQ